MDAHYLTKSELWESATSWIPSATEWSETTLPPEPSLVFPTSGSTGKPRQIVLTKKSLIASARCVNAHLGVDASSVWGLALPWWHVGGMGVAARSWSAGCRMEHFTSRWNAAEAVLWMEGITHLSLVPTQVHDLVTLQFPAPKSLRAVVVGGGKLDQATYCRARELGWPVLASFGMTETASQVATQSLDDDRLTILPCWETRVNENGLLELRGEPLFSGECVETDDGWIYEPRKSEWFTTKDRVKLEGRHLTWLGREDDLVKILGELVSLTAVESALIEAGMKPGSFIVVAQPDARMGNQLCLFSEESPKEALDSYHASCAGYCRIHTHRVMPLRRSALGKILKQQ